MPKPSISERLAAQDKMIKDAKQRAEKIKVSEAKRLLKIFEKVGFFEAEIADDQLQAALQKLVNEATGSSAKQSTESEALA